MNYRIDSEEKLLALAQRSTHLLVNIRHFQKKYEETGKQDFLIKKQKFEWQADELIKELNLDPSLKHQA
ncbi:MAG: hypothetical protein C5B59_08015 [Bacteroidetes bacterium]|nr:MAG: hypothetical protein C5B59_08015 [Bacteroidota bacterium]